ncbi:hypothetical protein M1L60_39420 [Actinoplanes sp. TRM 88003]|uniref:Uncharacterized protein n=1 Tax=Paractinoplanes aksuensis TaxID=2939490 RepID=A0ABT1E0W3_9ACTN|nr:hypothetical protein [Actinoplanes aksuensis]MCO8276667.1 hypothetical protein [Actinoplanes aksuensis]
MIGHAYRAARLAWWKGDPPAHLTELLTLACETYRGPNTVTADTGPET